MLHLIPYEEGNVNFNFLPEYLAYVVMFSFLLSFSQGPVDGNSEVVEILNEYCIPDYILLPDSEIKEGCDVPKCPLIIFINSKSGGQLGGDLLVTCRSLLNKNQVCFWF